MLPLACSLRRLPICLLHVTDLTTLLGWQSVPKASRQFIFSSGFTTAVGSKRMARSSFCQKLPKEAPEHVLTLLHKTASLLPYVLGPNTSSTDPAQSLEFWNHVLAGVYDNLSSKNEKKTRVAVVGVDEWSGSRELVTALLAEPFASDDSQNDVVRSRWHGHEQVERILTIEAGPCSNFEADDILRSSSSWLQGFPVPVQIVESSPPIGSEKPISEFISSMSKADITIFVCNPVTTPLAALFERILFLFKNSNVIVVLTSTPPSISQLSADIPSLIPNALENGDPPILIVDPFRALSALQSLKAGASSASVQRYQDDFVGSRVSTVTHAISNILESSQCHIGLNQIRLSLSACSNSLLSAECEMKTVCSGISELVGKVEEAKVKVPAEVFSGFDDNKGDIITTSLMEGRKEIETVMNELTWWRMTWRVDEVGIIVSTAVEKAWCRELEKMLIFQTGRLSRLQKALTSLTIDFVSSLSQTSPLYSPLLLNSLQQLTRSPNFPLTPRSLTSPIHTRLAQVQYPTARLHMVAQQSVLGVSATVAGGVGVSWACWFEELGVTGVGVETWVCVIILGSLAGVRWAVGTWERGKKGWWKDWERIGAGLDRDLKTTLETTMNDKVVVVPVNASKGLDELVRKRQAKVEALKGDLDTIWSELEKVERHLRKE